jgi:hypothetical protein
MMPFVVSLTGFVFAIAGTPLLPSRERLPPISVSVDVDSAENNRKERQIDASLKKYLELLMGLAR